MINHNTSSLGGRPWRSSVALLVGAGLVCAGGVLATASAAQAVPLPLGGLQVVSAVGGVATGTNATLFSLRVANAACPATTDSSVFTLNGPGIVKDAAFPFGYTIGANTGTPDGRGLQEVVGLSVDNIRTVNAGSFAADGTYTVAFECLTVEAESIAAYSASLAYTVAGSGAWTGTPIGTLTSGSPTATTAPSATTAPVATTTASATTAPTVTTTSASGSSTSSTSRTSTTSPVASGTTATTAPTTSRSATTATTATTTRALANTGSQGGSLSLVAVALILGGAVLVLLAGVRLRGSGRRQG